MRSKICECTQETGQESEVGKPLQKGAGKYLSLTEDVL